MTSRSRTINVAHVLSANLALRETAARFVTYIEGLPNSEVILDFSHVKTISRSFAHEYLARKRGIHKRVSEVNVSPDIAKMFEVVRLARTTRPSASRIDFEGIPVIDL